MNWGQLRKSIQLMLLFNVLQLLFDIFSVPKLNRIKTKISNKVSASIARSSLFHLYCVIERTLLNRHWFKWPGYAYIGINKSKMPNYFSLTQATNKTETLKNSAMVIVRNAMLLKISKADEDIPQMYQIATWKIPVTQTFSVFKIKKSLLKRNWKYIIEIICIRPVVFSKIKI